MTTPAFPPLELEFTEDLEFSAHGPRLDLLRLRERPAARLPAVLHLHGGGWAEQPPCVGAVGNVCGVMDFLDPAFEHGEEAMPLFGARFSEGLDLAVLARPAPHISPRSAPVSHRRGMHAPGESIEPCGDHFITDTPSDEVEQRLLAFFRRALAHLAAPSSTATPR